jgi:AraC-like DNA-binding protein
VYREWASLAVAGATAWTRTVPGDGAEIRVVPDGCMDLIWASGTLLVAGPDTRAQVTAGPPGASFAALRFPPGLAPSVLGVPAAELRDGRVELASLWRPAEARRLDAAAAAALDAAARHAAAPRAASGGVGPEVAGLEAVVTALESVAARRLGASGGPDPWVARLVGWLRAGTTVGAAAARAGLSERQLHRRSLPLFGYGPKTLGRVLRFDRALALARSGRAFAEVAADAGYADQAHLSREVRSLAGVPLGALV